MIVFLDIKNHSFENLENILLKKYSIRFQWDKVTRAF